MLQLTDGIPGLSQHQPAAARFRLEGRLLCVDGVAKTARQPQLRVYSLEGQQVASTAGTSLDLTRLPAGVYAVQLNTGDSATTGSTLIRLQ